MVSKKSKGGLKELSNYLDDKSILTRQTLKPKLFALLSEYHSKVPLYRLIEVQSNCSKSSPTLKEFDEFNFSITDERIGTLNKLLSAVLKEKTTIKKENLSSWYDNLTSEKCNKIINNATINELARVIKESPLNSLFHKISVESLKSIIYFNKIDWLNHITKDEILSERVMDEVSNDFEKIFFYYDTKQDFLPYIKTILFKKFVQLIRVNKPDNKMPRESNNFQQTFLTVCFLLFERLNFKPHYKLVFWYENMHYTKKSTVKALDHDRFFEEKGSCILKELWQDFLDEINMNYKEFIVSSDPGVYGSPEIKNVTLDNEFERFNKILESLVSHIYSESQYTYLRSIYKDDVISDVLLNDFLWNEKGVRYSDEEIRGLVSNWNTRIKKQLRKIFEKERGTIRIMER